MKGGIASSFLGFPILDLLILEMLAFCIKKKRKEMLAFKLHHKAIWTTGFVKMEISVKPCGE